jgi:hypothetical protein
VNTEPTYSEEAKKCGVYPVTFSPLTILDWKPVDI